MPPRPTFRPAGQADIALLRDLAEHIWRVSYAAMLPRPQIDYMLERMYAPETIAAEMISGVRWVVAELAGMPIGYLALSVGNGDSADLHKLYLLPDHQGSGLGQQMIGEACAIAAAAGATELRLRVNKTNAQALRSYERAGFRMVDALVADIGGGFVMDDYVLSVPLSRPSPLVKICGLSTPETLESALAAGADQIGLVFFPKSPRHVSLDLARDLAGQARDRAAIVALTVDAEDAVLDAILAEVAPDWLQFHGRESPERVEMVKRRAGRPVMKAVGVAEANDIVAAQAYRCSADRLLFDAKPPKGAALPGGNGISFDWTILRAAEHPFMLSGGLTPDNVGEALRVSRAPAVDVSSGVETAPGRKDPRLITAFVEAARQSGTAREAGIAPPAGLSDPLRPGDQS